MSTSLPSLYLKWFRPDVLAELRQIEPEAPSFNCQSCLMTAPRGRTRDLGPFKQELKCCTFTPFLPSFCLGELLVRPELHDVWEGYFRSVRLTPLGALPRVSGTSICEAGRHPEDRCAFLERNSNPGCLIFDGRPSPCASYVCSGGGDSDGDGFFRRWQRWGDAVAAAEWELAHDIAFEAGYTLDDVNIEFSAVSEALAFYRRATLLALELGLRSR